MEGCTLGRVFIVLEQEMQEFGRLGMLSDYSLRSVHAQKTLCGSHDPAHLAFGTIWWEMLKFVYPPIPSYHYKDVDFMLCFWTFWKEKSLQNYYYTKLMGKSICNLEQ